METKSKGKTAATVISHYSGPGAALTWTSEEEEKKWSRNIPGIDGALDAIESSSGSTTLQLHDLEGDIVGEAAVSETETKLLKSYNSTEFGVPSEGKAPPKYAWLGAGGVATEPAFGTGTVTQGGASYVPQIARNLQTAAVVPPGAFPDGPGTGSPRVATLPGWVSEMTASESAKRIAEYAPRQEALEREAQEKILKQCQEEGGCGAEPPSAGGDGCNEEAELCGSDPEHGDNWAGCKIWASWGGAGLSNDVGVYGRFSCYWGVPGFELEICAVGVGTGKNLGCNTRDYHGTEGNTGEPQHEVWECTPGHWYKAWIWGRYWGENGQTDWYATALDGRLEQCAGEIVDPGDPSGN